MFSIDCRQLKYWIFPILTHHRAKPNFDALHQQLQSSRPLFLFVTETQLSAETFINHLCFSEYEVVLSFFGHCGICTSVTISYTGEFLIWNQEGLNLCSSRSFKISTSAVSIGHPTMNILQNLRIFFCKYVAIIFGLSFIWVHHPRWS